MKEDVEITKKLKIALCPQCCVNTAVWSQKRAGISQNEKEQLDDQDCLETKRRPETEMEQTIRASVNRTTSERQNKGSWKIIINIMRLMTWSLYLY